jgi:hypothetical protein
LTFETLKNGSEIAYECVIETKASMILQFINGLRGVISALLNNLYLNEVDRMLQTARVPK